MLSWSALLKNKQTKKSVSLTQSLLVPSADVKGAFLGHMLLSNFRDWGRKKSDLARSFYATEWRATVAANRS